MIGMKSLVVRTLMILAAVWWMAGEASAQFNFVFVPEVYGRSIDGLGNFQMQNLTGQAQSGSLTQAQFKTYVCSQIPALFTCANLKVNVQSYPAFGSISNTSVFDGNGNFTGATNYCPGNGGDTVFVQLSYQWPLFVTGLGFNMSNPGTTKKWLTATAAFQNEPFSAPASGC